MGCDSSKEKEEAVRRQDVNYDSSALCNNQLRDPMTLAISFMDAPGKFRVACTFTRECWDQGIYLEVPLACSTASADVNGTKRAWPFAIKRTDMFEVSGPWQGYKVHQPILHDGKLETFKVRRPGPKAKVMPVPVTGLALRHEGLSAVTGSDWLSCCKGLEHVTIEHMPNLKSVGNMWLHGCASLKTVHFVDLPKLKKVGMFWLSRNKSLETVTFERLLKLESIEDPLGDTPSLKAVRFVDLPRLTQIGCPCDTKGSHLELIAFERLPKLKSLKHCTMSHGQQLGPSFQDWDWKCLKVVSMVDLPALTEVAEEDWLRGCVSLETARFERLGALRSVGRAWLQDCTSLKELILVGLPELTTVGHLWLRNCTSLENVAFEQLPKLQLVGSCWLSECSSLKSVSFADLPELSKVDSHWIEQCTSLESIRIERLPKLKSVESHWLSGCTSLMSVTFADLPQLSKVGEEWLGSCPALEDVTFEGLSKLTTKQQDLELPSACKVTRL